MTTRRAKHASGKPMQTNPDKQASESRGSAHTENEMDEEDPTQSIPDWLHPFTENLDDLETHVPAHPSEREISDSEGDASKVETQKRKHSIYAHFPEDRNCDMCPRTKITRIPCRRRNEGSVPRAEKFGDLITADDKVRNEGSESRNNHGYAVVVQDLATQWIQSYPCKNKKFSRDDEECTKFLEPSQKPKVIYTDNSLEFGKSCEELSGNHRTSTPHRSETNGIAERAIRRVKEGTSAVLLHFGLDDEWLSDSMECYCYLRNVQDHPGRRENFTWTKIWRIIQRTNFSIRCTSVSLDLRERQSENSSIRKESITRNLSRIYFDRGRGIWKGSILDADIKEYRKLDASEIYPRRPNAKEVLLTQTDGEFEFPVTDGHSEERESQRRVSRR